MKKLATPWVIKTYYSIRKKKEVRSGNSSGINRRSNAGSENVITKSDLGLSLSFNLTAITCFYFYVGVRAFTTACACTPCALGARSLPSRHESSGICALHIAHKIIFHVTFCLRVLLHIYLQDEMASIYHAAGKSNFASHDN